MGTESPVQIEFVVERLPAAFGSLTRELEIRSLRELVPTSSIGNLAARALAWGTTLFGAVASLVLVLVAGIYFAADPDTYRTGLVKLFPVGWHEQIKATIGDVEVALRRWLGGQLVAMVIVGILVADRDVGDRRALADCARAHRRLTEFVPLIGPFAGAIPALLLASTQGTDTLLWAIAVFIAVQQIENNAIMPIIAREAVEVPPALGLFAVVAFGVLLGPLGLLFGYPLAVVADAVVRRLWVREALGEAVETPTERVERHERNGSQKGMTCRRGVTGGRRRRRRREVRQQVNRAVTQAISATVTRSSGLRSGLATLCATTRRPSSRSTRAKSSPPPSPPPRVIVTFHPRNVPGRYAVGERLQSGGSRSWRFGTNANASASAIPISVTLGSSQ